MDFPGWDVFLGGYGFYPTWQEASNAAIKLGFKTNKEYKKGYRQDKRLPAAPNATYKDFPGWVKFLGKSKKVETDFYKTWQEASKSVVALGIKSQRHYSKQYKADPKLPSTPHHFYQDFPGWSVFLGGENKDFYDTWQEASSAAIKLGIQSAQEYRKRHSQDSKLPSNPNITYKNFPGYRKFLGKE